MVCLVGLNSLELFHDVSGGFRCRGLDGFGEGLKPTDGLEVPVLTKENI